MSNIGRPNFEDAYSEDLRPVPPIPGRSEIYTETKIRNDYELWTDMPSEGKLIEDIQLELYNLPAVEGHQDEYDYNQRVEWFLSRKYTEFDAKDREMLLKLVDSQNKTKYEELWGLK